MKIEGKNNIRELLKKEDVAVDKVLVENFLKDRESKELIAKMREKKFKVQFVDKKVLDGESESKRHQGFIAYATEYKYAELDDIISSVKGDGLIVIADSVTDPHNLGSIVRICECVGADGLIIGKHRAVSVNDTVLRVSEGAANHVKIARVTNINDAILKLKDNFYNVIGAEADGENLYDAKLSGNIALVVGGEDTGIKTLTRKYCDRVVSIPMYGKLNSLNVSVALGICAFEIKRKLKG